MSEHNIREEDEERIKKACEQLGESYDSVQIFVTRHEAGELGGTVNLQWGAGNYFTRSGQVREWLIKQDEKARDEVRERE